MAEQPDPTAPEDATENTGVAETAEDSATPADSEGSEDAEPAQPAEPAEAVSAARTTAAGAPATVFSRAAAAARSRPAQSWLRVAVAAAVFVGAFALAGGLGYQLWRQHVVTRAGEQAEQTAVDYAAVLTSISSEHVDENFTTILNGATGEFKDMYAEASMDLRDVLLETDSGAESAVIDSAIQSASADQVVLLLMIDQKVTNSQMEEPRTDSLRMKMTMDNIDGRWLASKVELP